jgi:hypothetical protein
MIISKQIITLTEKYLTSKRVHTFNGDRELVLYVNPDTSERQDIILSAKKSQKGGAGPYVRFIADAKAKKVYVWDAYEGDHVTGRNLVGLPATNQSKTPWLLYGTGEPAGGYKLKFVAWDSKPLYSEYKFYFAFLDYDWSWLSPYIDTKEFFAEIHKRTDLYRNVNLR